MDRGLHLLLRVLDELDDFARFLDWDALLHGDALADRGACGGLDGPVGEGLQRHAALHQFALQDIVHRLELELVGRGEHQRFFLVHLNVGLGVLQVVTRMDFLERLLDSIGNLLQVNLTDNVE